MNKSSSGLPAISTIQIPRRFVTDAWGGTETTILNCSRALIAAGNPTRIHTSLALSAQTQTQLKGVPVRRFSYHYPWLGLSDQQRDAMDRKGGNMVSMALFRSLLREPDVDLLHAHTGKRLGAIVRTAARLRKLPYVVSLHGGFFDSPEAQREQLQAPALQGMEWGKAVGAVLGSRRVLQDAAAVVCVGDNEYQAARAALPNNRIELLPNGVDCNFFDSGDGAQFRRHFAIPDSRRIVLCVSRIDEQKNQIALVDALPAVLAQHPDTHVVMIGPVTAPAYAERLQQRIAQLNLSDHISCIEGLTADDPLLQGAYQAADLFCLPTLHEPFGIVILEAWAAGLPVVASKVGGIPSFTQHGVNCLHSDPQRAETLPICLNRLLGDPVLASYLGQNGRTRARENFDWTRITQRLLALYRDIIDTQGKTPCA
jgi:glycosyltransferase involved in cell wall biosynthesis